MFQCSKHWRGYSTIKPRSCFGHLNFGYLKIVSIFDLPAHAYLGRTLQPPQAVRQDQIGDVTLTWQWQAGIRISDLLSI